MQAGTNVLRRLFWVMNKFLMIPMIRLGLLPLMGTPLGGWMMMLTTTGNVTGKRRFTPVNYALIDGSVYCLAGFGKIAHWYRNIQADPHVETLLPSGPLAGRAQAVTDPDERLASLRQILKNSGFATFVFGGMNPFRVSDDRLQQVAENWIVIRIQPTGIGSGVGDPGGLLWVWYLIAIAVIVYFVAGPQIG